ncbi:MAG: DUF2309 domain-containing protein, partial [Rhodospirillales bacterium]|nr:DUF2309 domain-containing protein [Rhodospirillales bacterium]
MDHASCTTLPAPEEAAVSETTAPVAYAPSVRAACDRIAPVWRLRDFVAVNPFLGYRGESFAQAAARAGRVLGARMVMPRAFYRAALASGRMTAADLDAARPDALTPSALRQALAADTPPPSPLATTVAEVLDRMRGTRMAAALRDEIGKFCAAYWDEGQASWHLPWRDRPLFQAWRAMAQHDRAPDALGLHGLRAGFAALPDDADAAIESALALLDLPAGAVEVYLHRALAGIGGWAAYARHLAWTRALHGDADTSLRDLLAIRLAWDAALFRPHRQDAAFRRAWRTATTAMATTDIDRPDADLLIDCALQDAYEHALQRDLIARLSKPATMSAASRKAVQAAFCIDVRSEPYRRALEAASPAVETIGFAGFFGFPIEHVPFGHAHGAAQCPVLLAPRHIVCDAVVGASPAEAAAIGRRQRLRRLAAKAWKAFRSSAISSFSYVETTGLVFAAKLAGNALALTRPGASPLAGAITTRLAPALAPEDVGGRRTGIAAADRLALAEAALRGMSLTGDFARIVLLVGHGSTTANNPHAAGLACGACGGHGGEANARVAAAVLNDPAVRAGLRGRGIDVPGDTWFLPALHDTTTDAVTLHDLASLPATHRDDLARLRAWLDTASATVRAERAPRLGLGQGRRLAARLARRGRDWSQVRPEWGLAGNAAFIAAPRARTRGVDLGGRAFLHSYDWRRDEGFRVLEQILTAPLVVANWINLQYFGATVDNAAFGAGTKVLHNVVGTVGVLQGQGGDLQVGLPWQSVHDGA